MKKYGRLNCMRRYDKASKKSKIHFYLETRMLHHKRVPHIVHTVTVCTVFASHTVILSDQTLKNGLSPVLPSNIFRDS